MRINRSLLGWGIFLIVLGAVPLAVRQGMVPEESVARAWTIWPLLLIFSGLGLVLRRTPLGPLAELAVAATFGLIVGGVVASGSIPMAGCGDEGGSVPFQARSGELGSAAEVDVQLLCGELTVRTAPGTTWTIDGSDNDGGGPQVEATPDRLEIRADPDANFLRARDRWTVTLPTGSELDLEAQVNAGTGQFALDDARLQRLAVHVNAGETTIDLGSVAAIEELDVELNAVGDSRIVLPALSFSGSIQANAAGGIRICAPTGVGLRLTANDSVAASYNYGDRGMVRDGDTWETPNYDSAAVRIDLRTQANAGSFELEPEGACDA